jgi:hypothetical protein
MKKSRLDQEIKEQNAVCRWLDQYEEEDDFLTGKTAAACVPDLFEDDE